jgi:hypothetical protein
MSKKWQVVNPLTHSLTASKFVTHVRTRFRLPTRRGSALKIFEVAKLRLSTMSSPFARRDLIVVASVSCIHGIGSREDYEATVILKFVGQWPIGIVVVIHQGRLIV